MSSTGTPPGSAVGGRGARLAGLPMRFHVDGWDPSYGSSVEEGTPVAALATRIDAGVEVPVAAWAPVDPSALPEPSAILFVDGVRRIDARLWIEEPATVDAATGELMTGGDASMAVAASYAAGIVCCCPDQGAHLVTAETRHGLFTTAAHASDVVTSAGTYQVHVTADDPDQSAAVLLSEALQRRLLDLELVVAANARATVAAESGCAAAGAPTDASAAGGGDDMLVKDGPLPRGSALPRALGFIKSHRTSYLPAEQHAMVSRLGPGQRTPVFLVSAGWDRWTWYLRLPCRPGAPWAGIVRVECSAEEKVAGAVALANLSQTVLPRFASAEYKDARAPQNLVPVAGLERELRRRLGHSALLARALRVAASF